MKIFFFILLLIGNFIQTRIDKNYLLGRFDPAIDARFVHLTSTYAQGSALNGFLRKETFEAFQRMAVAANKNGINLFIVSATRNFASQKKIWESKWNGMTKVEGKDLTSISDFKKRAQLILLYSSMPGTSRHHWGTDIDLNSLDNNYFTTGKGLKIYQWLSAHALEYGFCQPYTSKASGRKGYEEEKWHWSYLPLSKLFLEEYKKQISYPDISGFEGSEQAPSLEIFADYVDGVACH
jgi:D-alanyl-D-alanine carboxypeptidase